MQMPNASPQGIAGLMQKPPGQVPGQQPMPSPNKASPMAGLGSVDDRVSAYAGNTKPLEQRYAASQDLLDLLALQKIKSQKDAAARDMQLQMAQQQAEGGEANMTVAQQREKEVGDMTKNELAQQRGDTAQQQTSQQQAMMQKMMGGIAGAPGANAAAQPKMMATGGIVGYAGGGDVLDQARERRKAAQQKVYTYGLRQRQQDPEGFQAAQAELQAAEEAARAAEKGYASEMSAAGVDKLVSAASPMGAVGRYERAQAPAAPERPPVSEAQATAAAGPQAVVPPASVVAAAQGAPRPAAPPAPPKPPGIAGLPGAAAAPAAPAAAAGPAAPAVPDFNERVKKAELGAAELDYMKQGRDEEKRVEGRLALTPEQRKVHEEGIGGLQKMYQEQYDPERQQREGLKRALIGAGGRRYGELGAAATAGMDYDASQRTAKLKEFGDVQKARTGLIDIDRGAIKGGLEAGASVAKEGSATQRQGLASAANVYSTDVGSRDKALDREIEKLKIGAQNAATAAAREGLTYDKARTAYAATMSRVQELERKLDDGFNTQYGMLLMQEQTGKLEPSQKTQLEIAKLELQGKKAKLRKELEPVLESARQKLGVSGMSGMSAEDKALVDQYAKGK